MFTKPCPCGFNGPGYRKKPVGRVDDMLVVDGTAVFPTEVKEVVTTFMPRVTGAMRIVLKGPLKEVTPPLKVKLEWGMGVAGDGLAGLQREVERALRDRLGVACQAELVEPHSLEWGMLKTPLFAKD